MSKISLPLKIELALVSVVLLLAGFLRLGWPGLTEFKQDEAHLYALALDLAEFKAFPLRGISSSVGLPNAPISVYLYALPLFVWKSPLAATLFAGALNTASVALAYGMARRYWGLRAALISALLYAAAPWAVIYSRKIWAQDLLPLFVVGYVFTGLLAFVESRSRWVIAHFILLAVIIQIHFSGIALLPLTALPLLIFRKRVNWRMAGWGALGALATATPFVIYAAMQGSWGAGQIGAFLSRPAEISADALRLSALVVLGTQVHALAGPQAFRAFLATLPDLNLILYLGGVLVVLGMGSAIWHWANRLRKFAKPPLGTQSALRNYEPAEAGLMVVLWLVLPILIFIRHSTPVFPHYFILLFPAPYLLSGIGLDALLARLPARWQRFGLWLLPLLIAGSQVWLSLALLRFIGAHNTPGAFGTPLGMLIETAETAKRLSSADVLVVSDGADPSIDSVPAVFDVLLRDVPRRFADGRTTAVFPVGNASVVLWPGDYPGVELYRQWGGGQWSNTVPLRAGEGEVRFAAGSGIALAVPRPREASALLGNGAELLGSGGNARRWELWWHAPGPTEGENYHVFAHLLNANGERVSQSDLATYAARDWRAGDLVVNYFALQGEGVTVRAGMYAYPSLAPAQVLDVAGSPAGEWIEFPIR